MKRTKDRTKPKLRFTKEEEADLAAFTMRGELDDVADYIARGRKFGPLSDEEMCDRFIGVRKVADNPAELKISKPNFKCVIEKFRFELSREDFERLRIIRTARTEARISPRMWIIASPVWPPIFAPLPVSGRWSSQRSSVVVWD